MARSINEIKTHMEQYGPKIEDVRELCALYEKMIGELIDRRVNPPVIPVGYAEWSRQMG